MFKASAFSILVLSYLAAAPALAANIPSLPSSWNYVGCIYEGNGQRVLSLEFYDTPDMTISICVQYCNGKNQPYAGLEIGTQCFCGSSLTIFQTVTEDKCGYACGGDSTQQCGGYGYMSFFSTSANDPRSSSGSGAGGSVVSSTTSPSQSINQLTQSGKSVMSTPSPAGSSSPYSTSSPTSSSSSQQSGFTLPPNFTSAPPNNPSSNPTTVPGPVNTNADQSPTSFNAIWGSPSSGSVIPGAVLPTATASIIPGWSTSGDTAAPNFRNPSQNVVFGKTISAGFKTLHRQIFPAPLVLSFVLLSPLVWLFIIL